MSRALARYVFGTLAAMLLVAASVRLVWLLISPALLPVAVLLILALALVGLAAWLWRV